MLTYNEQPVLGIITAFIMFFSGAMEQESRTYIKLMTLKMAHGQEVR